MQILTVPWSVVTALLSFCKIKNKEFHIVYFLMPESEGGKCSFDLFPELF